MAGFWDKLRTALDLAARVQAVEDAQQQLTDEWTDVLDKIHRRWERDRKRQQREIVREDLQPEPELAPNDVKAQLRARVRMLQNGGRGA